jgi:2-aminoethylphosphonate-pyruvate transaminase
VSAKLLNPGPVTLTARVRRALASPDVCHREPEFAEVVARVRERLTRLTETSGDPAYIPVLLAGSGTAAVEAMLSLIAKTESSLVVANGVYGERVAAMLRLQGKRHEVIASPWTSPIDVAAADRALASGAFGHVITVHHETTTGRLNDLGALGAAAARHGVPMLVDAVSSFGGEVIDLAAWNIEAVAATANKCLHGAPGVSFVLAHERALGRPSGATSLYLDLRRHADAQRAGSSPFTLPTHVVFALDEALAELSDEGGVTARNAVYKARSGRIRGALAELGVALLLDSPGAYGAILTSYRVPKTTTYPELHARLKRAGFVIYAGQGDFDGSIFRVAVMGDLDDPTIERLIQELHAALG